MPSVGIDRRTGKLLTGWQHVVQSIEDILTTRVMTRVMRRDYGSDAPRLIDAPMNERSLMALYVAIAEALETWEPRFRLTNVTYTTAGADGALSLALVGIYYPRGHLGDLTPENGGGLATATILLNEARPL